MPVTRPKRLTVTRKKRLAETIQALTALQFGPRQRNEVAAYTLLALLDLRVELELLADHFTVTSLIQAIVSHPLAVFALAVQPSLLRRYRLPSPSRPG